MAANERVAMMWWDGGAGWGGWLAMSLLMIVVWGVLIFGGIALWRAASRSDRGQPPAVRPTPEQLLDERLARGEIDIEEYRQRRELLRSGR